MFVTATASLSGASEESGAWFSELLAEIAGELAPPADEGASSEAFAAVASGFWEMEIL